MLSPELQNRMSEWRAKAAAGTITLAEMKDAIVALRGSRKTAAEAASASKSKKPAKSADALLGELEGL